MTCYMQIFYVKNERIGRIENFEICVADLLSRDNNKRMQRDILI